MALYSFSEVTAVTTGVQIDYVDVILPRRPLHLAPGSVLESVGDTCPGTLFCF